MFFIMQKKGSYIVNRTKYKEKKPVLLKKIKGLSEARKCVEDRGGIYIDYGQSEINRVNRELRDERKRK